MDWWDELVLKMAKSPRKSPRSPSTPGAASKVTALVKRPAFHVACVIGFLFVTTVVADNVITSVSRTHITDAIPAAVVALFRRA
mmetsp:Transcript_12490/g.27255  ORF Transcript_12490/g.27255 Transcript_12490/m.27255 type:complete len:84 (+) Transcript_12490:199-450(+)